MDSFPDASSIPPFDEDILDTATIVPSEIEWPPDPQVITDFLTVIRVNLSAPCPLGFVCDETRQANCTEIRIVSIGYGFGDVHAGGWCPEGLDGLQLCPVGHYCPTAEELILCPGTNNLCTGNRWLSVHR